MRHHPPTRAPASLIARMMMLALAAVLALTACASNPDDDTSGDASGNFPVTIETKFGDVEIPAEPERVVTIGYTDHEAVYALGVAPVAVTPWFEQKIDYPWAADAIEKAGGEQPELLDDPFSAEGLEQINDLEPDLIIAVFSYLTEEQWKSLSELAPTVVGAPEFANDSTPWQDQTTMIGTALGKADEAEKLVADAETAIADIGAEHPEFAGATAVPGSDVIEGGEIALFSAGDNEKRGAIGSGYLLPQMGFEIDKAYGELEGEETAPRISTELIDLLDQDVIVWAFASDHEAAGRLKELAAYQALPAVQEGREVYAGKEVGYALYFSSVLSLPYAAEALAPQLVAALDGDPGTSSEPTD